MILMSKFTKRLEKNSRVLENCIVVGSAFGNLESLCDIFNTVFVLSDGDRSFKRKNVVYREDFDDISILPNISVIFIDADKIDKIGKLKSAWTRYWPTIFIGSGEFIDRSYSKMLNGNHYEIVELYKDYQIWKLKK
jgi:hypothetical protein